ncbi:hypothetical protein ACFZAK_28410 [Streptomyces albidoflavus]
MGPRPAALTGTLLVVLGTVGTLLLLAGITALGLGPALLLPSVCGGGA